MGGRREGRLGGGSGAELRRNTAHCLAVENRNASGSTFSLALSLSRVACSQAFSVRCVVDRPLFGSNAGRTGAASARAPASGGFGFGAAATTTSGAAWGSGSSVASGALAQVAASSSAGSIQNPPGRRHGPCTSSTSR